ncbi:calcium-binding protein [Jannaschia seohaensis]|uniref:Hemolysin type calcium-binding protein n=1 Tax=Jannaschia seohaensis TaxID=475081 RepID=A0A2Y9BZG7_9RHOB|nr:calcium-binding protein [Jannaschia seohaensis]PWJ20297.1 hemolysin type calcium-binding protein [Jannaschia seohaensis]SSA44322.1 Hemolysin-type calcium-binding repeat-containing protein [Jannaschia seohaensis]
MGIVTAIGVVSGLATLGDILQGWIKDGTIEGGFAGFFDPEFDQEAAFDGVNQRLDGIETTLGRVEASIVDLMDDVDTLAQTVELQGRDLSTNIDATALAVVRGEVYSVLSRVSNYDNRTDVAADLVSESSLAFGSAYELAGDILGDAAATPEAIAAAVGTLTYATATRLLVAQTVEEGGHREGDVQQNITDAAARLGDLRTHLVENLDIDVRLDMSREANYASVEASYQEPVYWNLGIFGTHLVGYKTVTYTKKELVSYDNAVTAKVSADGYEAFAHAALHEAMSEIHFSTGLTGTSVTYTKSVWNSPYDAAPTFWLPMNDKTFAFLEGYDGTVSWDLSTNAGRATLDAYLDFHVENMILEDLGFGYGGQALETLENVYTEIADSTEQDLRKAPAAPTDGDDYIKGTEGRDTISGEDGNDVLVGHGGDDRLYGGAGNDILKGGAGNDQLYGGTGDDGYIGGAGNDRIVDAGGTNDRVLFEGKLADHTLVTVGDQLHVSKGGETDYLQGIDVLQFDDVTVEAHHIGTAGADALSGTAQADFLYGGTGDDVFRADGGNDLVFGGAGNDVIHGGAGSDRIDGGSGNDRIYDNGNGDDAYVASSGNDRISDYGGSRDVIEFDGASSDYSIVLTYIGIGSFKGPTPYVAVTGADGITQMSGVDMLEFHDRTIHWSEIDQTRIATEGDDILTGTGHMEFIDGKAGNDVIDGREGNDKITGGSGLDVLTGGEGADTFMFLLSEGGADTVTDFNAAEGDRLLIRSAAGNDYDAAFLAERTTIDAQGRMFLDIEQASGAPSLPLHVATFETALSISADIFV